MERKKFSVSWKFILLGVFALAVMVVTVATVPLYARYVKQTEDVSNIFSRAEVTDPSVDESFDGVEKSNVKISVGETGYPVYVRATIVITWKKLVEVDGKFEEVIYYDPPVVDDDYTLALVLTELTDGWKKGSDGFYYYTSPVTSGGETSVLISSCKQMTNANVPDGYFLSVDVIAQTIQAVGSTDDGDIPAYEDAWGAFLAQQQPVEP